MGCPLINGGPSGIQEWGQFLRGSGQKSWRTFSTSLSVNPILVQQGMLSGLSCVSVTPFPGSESESSDSVLLGPFLGVGFPQQELHPFPQ